MKEKRKQPVLNDPVADECLMAFLGGAEIYLPKINLENQFY
jgi:hypothetical protein